MNRFSRHVHFLQGCVWYSRRHYSRAVEFKQSFEALLGPENVLSQPTDMDSFTTDWLKSYKGGSLVCLPKSTTDVEQLMKFCHEHAIPVVCQGGNTGLVGGSVGTHLGELILSMSKMNKVINVDPVAGTVTCEAGCVLEALNNTVSTYGYAIPLDLGAKGSCMIGGNLATNAGGLRVIKFGSLHNAILGMEVVLANGTKLDMLRNIHKDNCGYPLKHAFIGSEGTLGIITKVCLKLAIKPKYTSVLLLKVEAFAKLGRLLVEAKQCLGDTLSAFEFIEGACFDLYKQHNKDVVSAVTSDVIPSTNQLAALVEVSGSSEELDKLRCERFVEHVFERGLVSGGVMAADSKQERNLWKVREFVPVELLRVSRMVFSLPGGLQLHSKLFKFDLSLPLLQVPAFVEDIRRGFQQRGYEVFNFGHAGDQNIHLNIIASFPVESSDKEWETKKQALIDQLQNVMEVVIYPPILSLRGSLSAEHGVGLQKKKAMLLSRSHEEIEVMKGIKALLDPQGILNPGKVL
eukprot:gene25484-30767_t